MHDRRVKNSGREPLDGAKSVAGDRQWYYVVSSGRLVGSPPEWWHLGLYIVQ